jgi:hypothetical protein
LKDVEVILEIGEEGSRQSVRIKGALPPAPDILRDDQGWESAYRSFNGASQLKRDRRRIFPRRRRCARTFKPEQVSLFVNKWFAGSPEKGQRLREELGNAGKERIRDAVRNPLRLALLCRTWQQREI